MTAAVERVGLAAYPLLRILAPVDAFLLPGAALYWVMSWPGHGEAVGAFLGVACVWWGVKRASTAINGFDEYRWMTLRLAKLTLVVYFTMALFKLVWLIQG